VVRKCALAADLALASATALSRIASSSSRLSSSLSLSCALLFLLAISFPFPRLAGCEELLVSLRGSGWLHAGWVGAVVGYADVALCSCR
jgi:hypothetical protein